VAFGVLVTRYRDHAYGLALRITRSAPDAEEVAQDAFVSAWNAIASFRGDAAFGTWLYRIVYRKALDRVETLRNRGRREVAVDDPARVEAQLVEADRGTPGAGIESGGVAAKLERLIAELSETARAVVTLYYYKDLSVTEVANALDIPEGTVKTHLHRARAALRKGWLQETGERENDAL
jgi:RNA polymerase sigma-70 factor (ECF subfamily)